ncbi:MAG: hypothetical protein AB7P04_11990 [Bacteriovoracia bacterium]
MRKPKYLLAIVLVLAWLENASLPRADASEFEKKSTALMKVLGTKQAFPVPGAKDAFYSKDAKGKVKAYGVVESGIYPPNCTHTWVIGMDAGARVKDIRVLEMSCPHAFPAKQASFLAQYKGKGPADYEKLKGSVETIAKATGSCDLTTDAVKRAIKNVVAATRKK